MCDVCDGSFHWSCLKPPLTSLPQVGVLSPPHIKGEWLCPTCRVYPHDIDATGRSTQCLAWFPGGCSAYMTEHDLLTLPNGKEVVERQQREDEQNACLVALANNERELCGGQMSYSESSATAVS